MIFINHTEVMGGSVAIVKIDGPLDSFTSPDFEEYIGQLLDKKASFILLDALKLDYVSSEGIGVILLIQKRIAEQNGFFIIFNLPDEVRSLYEVLGFDKVFRMARDQAEAMQIMDRQIELRERGGGSGGRQPEQRGSVEPQADVDSAPTRQGPVFFPFVIECANCKSLIRIKQSGEYLCPECRAEFTVLPDQTAIF